MPQVDKMSSTRTHPEVVAYVPGPMLANIVWMQGYAARTPTMALVEDEPTRMTMMMGSVYDKCSPLPSFFFALPLF